MIIEIQMMVMKTLKVSSMTKSVVTVDVATSGASGIVQHLEKPAINVVRRTILELCVGPAIVDLIQSQGVT